LAQSVRGLQRPHRVRLLVGRDGKARVELGPLDPLPDVLQVALARHPIDRASPFVFHKTTDRTRLDRERLPGYDDTILWNPDREITESIIANIVAEVDGGRVTPPVECGLLPGTLRAELLARGEIAERRITIDELRVAPRFWLINSVRGWLEARL